MRKFILFVFSLFMVGMIAAQSGSGSKYQSALGVKIYPAAISYKHFLKDTKAIEGLGYLSSDGFRLTGLYELHFPMETAEGLQWYVGAGAHVGAWSSEWKDKHPGENESVAIGVDGVLGLDYKIKSVPLNLSLDWQPSFNFIGYNYFEGGWGGLAIRYTF